MFWVFATGCQSEWALTIVKAMNAARVFPRVKLDKPPSSMADPLESPAASATRAADLSGEAIAARIETGIEPAGSQTTPTAIGSARSAGEITDAAARIPTA